MEENFLQGDEEKLLGIPVQPLCDREKAKMAYGQIGFIEYLVAPFLLTVTKVRERDAQLRAVLKWDETTLRASLLTFDSIWGQSLNDLFWILDLGNFNFLEGQWFTGLMLLLSLLAWGDCCGVYRRKPPTGPQPILQHQVLPPAENMFTQLMLNVKSWQKEWEAGRARFSVLGSEPPSCEVVNGEKGLRKNDPFWSKERWPDSSHRSLMKFSW